MSVLEIIMLLTAVAFFWYGLSCIFSKKMRKEFIRFGLTKWRVLTGVLQVLGALGLAFGIFYATLAVTAAFGLALLMLLGFITRIRIKDGILESAPAFGLMLLNMYLCYRNFLFL